MGEKGKPLLSISMLVSNNRRDTIEKCMESLVPLMEAVPSELIIVDTGCTDGSVDVARNYADRVVEFTWCNDFSAARNAGLSLCTGEWFLYLDDDEWFDDVSELISFFKSKESKYYDTLWYIQRNYDNMEGTAYTDTRVGRTVRMTPETRFCGKIHEWLEPLPKVIKKVDTFVHHYGYVYKTEEDRRKHLERNLTLEEEAVKENPDDIRMCCQLVQEYRVARRYEDAKDLCNSTLERTNYTEANSFVQYLLGALPRIYNEQEKPEEALAEFERLEREVKLMHQTKILIYYERSLIYGRLKRYEEVLEECDKYFKELSTVPKAGEPVEFPVMDFEHYCSAYSIQRLVKAGITAVLQSEDYSQAEELFEKVDWEADKKNASDYLLALLQCYMGSENVVLLTKYIPKLLRIEFLEQQVYGGLHSLYEKHPEKRERFLEDLEQLNLRSGNFSFFHLLYTESKGITTEEDVEEYYEKSDRKYDGEVVALLFGNTRLLPKVLEHTPIELYKEAMSILVAGKDAFTLEGLLTELERFENCYSKEKKRFLLYGAMVIAEKRLVLAAEQTFKVEECLATYLDAAGRYARSLYLPELLTEENCEALPANLRFFCIMEAASAKEQDFAAWGEAVKRAAKEYPGMLPVVRALLEERKLANRQGKTAQTEAGAAKQELLALAEQLKAMVREQLAQGKKEEAGAILSELAGMLPEDEEVKEMLGMLG